MTHTPADNNVRVKYLKDYAPPSYLFHTTSLDVDIHDDYTRVTCTIAVHANPALAAPSNELLLHGGGVLQRQSIKRDGEILKSHQYREQGTDIVIFDCPEQFVIETVCHIRPQDNTSLEGLYRSGGMYCTQCEAEGFRNITYYQDRPDVMSVFTTRISADKARFPILLSNGNPTAFGDIEGNRHFATWHDPFPKPAYLFALVAGDLHCQMDQFTTRSGRQVDLRIYVEVHNRHKCDHAMASLQRSMVWDEQKYGREYDLDLFMIVAVDDFNMGAMENKGLNIFNSDCVLADPNTTTDEAFERIEGIVAHEYFHNWSGNRVTCRDWFQLSLKEGFTVFRDAQYTADTYSATVKRIDDVTLLRTAQFAEDSGPMAHPVQPASYIEINNFYSITVYEKGAEVVGMLHTLLGEKLFRQGSDLYFSRYDGQAVTIDEFVSAMADASGQDLTQFKRWYSQAGTPTLVVCDEYDATQGEYWLHVSQSTPATPEAQSKQPFHIPVRMALIASGSNETMPIMWPTGASAINTEATEGVLSITQEQQSFCFHNVAERPVPSLLRGFSAPVKLNYEYSDDQLLFLARHDTDGFNRWEAVQRLLYTALQGVMNGDAPAAAFSPALMQLLASYLADRALDPAMAARLITMPSETYIAEQQTVVDVDQIYHGRHDAMVYIAGSLQQELKACYERTHDRGVFQQDGLSIGRRALKNCCLGYLSHLQASFVSDIAKAQYETRANMTDVRAALQVLQTLGDDASETALADFYVRGQNDVQVVDQWLHIQATHNKPNNLSKVKALMEHPAFDLKNPNKVRRLIGGFMSSPINFHARDGSGYAFIANQVIALNGINPMMAAALCKPLGRFKKHTQERQVAMRSALKKILAHEPAGDVFEVASKALDQSL